MSFVGNELAYAQEKTYRKNEDESIPYQKNRKIQEYEPSQKEVEKIKELIKYFSELYNIKNDICRIDFMKNQNGIPILLEFEMVNPGFFIGYMDKTDKRIKSITKKIRKYCEKCCIEENS